MKEPIRILFDWGSTLIRDEDLFNYIALQSGNKKTKWESPSSWSKVRVLGGENYFNKIVDTFFQMGDEYLGATECVSSFCSIHSPETESFVIFDNKPALRIPPEKILKKLSDSLKNRKCDVNMSYIGPDKISISKQVGIRILVEDDPRIAISSALSGIKTILMLRKWNRFFRIEDIEYTTKEENIEKIKSNIIIVEDWFEAGIQISKLVDKMVSS